MVWQKAVCLAVCWVWMLAESLADRKAEHLACWRVVHSVVTTAEYLVHHWADCSDACSVSRSAANWASLYAERWD